jgi:hypothetical protein
MPPWVLDSTISHATKRQLQFMYDVGVLAPFMLDVVCVQQLEKLNDGEAAYALDELGKALSDRVRLRNPTGFFIRICQRLRSTRRERGDAPPPAAAAGGGGGGDGPAAFAEREREREREQRERGSGGTERDKAAEGGSPGGSPGGQAGGGSSLSPPRGPYALPGLRPGRGRGGLGDGSDEPLHDGPPGGGGPDGPAVRGRRGRSSSRSPPPRRGGGGGFERGGGPGFWGGPGGALVGWQR